MADIMTPTLGESVTEATVARWTKQAGDAVRKDEILVELETDKVSLEVASPSDGVLSEITAEEGATVEPGAVLGKVSEGAAAAKTNGRIVVFANADFRMVPARKDYGQDRYARIAQLLVDKLPGSWTFTLITGHDALPSHPLFATLAGLGAVDCLDVFGSADVVVGNDTGLTHLAAMTERADGTSPHVIGLYGRHAYNKWTTGHHHHHAVATPFSQMLAAADRCPVRDRLDDSVWAESANLDTVAAELVVDLITDVAGP